MARSRHGQGIRGTRLLPRLANNPTCELQAAMLIEHIPEPELYQRLTGERFPGEYGERQSARRRGAKFEDNLTRNNADELRRSLAPVVGRDPDGLWVHNFEDQETGYGRRPGELNAVVLAKTRTIFRDLAADRRVPDVLIQAQLALPLGAGPKDFMYVIPDALLLDPAAGMYRPVEQKSLIVRDNVLSETDLARTRMQAAAQVRALGAEMAQVGLADRVIAAAIFVYASPQGLKPRTGVVETLEQELHAIDRSLDIYRAVRERLALLRGHTDVPLEDLAVDLRVHYQEQCVAECALARYCRSQLGHRAAALGDVAAELLGPEMNLHRLRRILQGTATPTVEEARVARALSDAIRILGRDPVTLRQVS